MDISKPNPFGVLATGYRDIVARHDRSFASVNVALCDDGLYRYSTTLMYSYGGFSGPVFIDDTGLSTLAAAIDSGLDDLLRRWHRPFPGEPQSVHDELDAMRRQIEARRQQPSLF